MPHMQLQRSGLCTRQAKVSHVPSGSVCTARRVCCAASKQKQQKQSRKQQSSSSEPVAAETASSSEVAAAPSEPVTREFTALGSKVVESNVAFKGPEDEKDFWEGDKFDAFGKALENYFIPGLIALGVVCGGIAAKSYNDGATAFVKPAPGPEAEASIIIAIPEAAGGAPSISN